MRDLIISFHSITTTLSLPSPLSLSLLCLYCEGVFKDRITLKEHMRKKQHKKINPNNTEYDRYIYIYIYIQSLYTTAPQSIPPSIIRFYVINYLEAGRTWQEVLAEEDEGKRQRHE